MEKKGDMNLRSYTVLKEHQIWISHAKKEVMFTQTGNYENLEFDKNEYLMDYIKACIACGYKVG